MKAKHLLFSSVFLSMGFAACTNEVEEFAPQAQDKEFVGEELGKLTIDVTNSNFSADDAETRATLEKVGNKWIAKWGDNDAIGAAWFNRIKTNEGVVTLATPIYQEDFGYGSNAIFNWVEGNTFACDAMCMAGAYVLYYPYNLNATDDLTAINVKKIGTPQTFKTSDVTEQVKENITAANVVSFRKGSQDLSSGFTVKQIPNLYALTFAIEDENLLKLGSTFKISRIYVEATKSGAAAINTDGTVGPDYDMNDAAFNYTISKENWNNEDGEVLPQINFVGGEKKVSRMQINVTNDNKETEKDYWITALGKPTGKFYFSMLPTEDFDNLTIKVVGKMGNATKIFKAEYPSSLEYFTDLKNVMMGQGEALTLNVDLNIEELDKGIYDVPQFVEAWKAGQRTFELAEELDLTTITDKKVNFTDAENNGHVIFSGEKVTLPTINGMYTFLNQAYIKGDATIVRCEEWDTESGITKNQHNAFTNADATIEGNLIVEGEAGVNINGKTTVVGNLTTKCNLVINEKLTVNKDLINETGKITVDSHAQVEGNLTVNGEFVGAKGKATIGGNLTIAEGAKVKLSYINVTGTVEANGEFQVVKDDASANAIIAGKLTANAPVVFDNVKIQDVDANAEVTIKEVTEMGNLTAKADVTITGVVTKMGNLTTVVGTPAEVSFGAAVNEIGNIIAAEGSTVTFNGAVTANKITTDVNLTFPAAATVTEDITINKGTVTAKSTLSAKNITVAAKHSELIAKSKNLTVSGKLTANGKVDAISSTKNGVCIGELVIADGIIVTLNGKSATEKCVIGNLDINKDMTFFGTLVGDYIAVNGGENEGTINVPNFTINAGTFAQKGTFTGAITVVEDATLDVDANTKADVTNNGTVDVAAGVSIIGEVVNNNTIDLYGILNEDNGAITLAEGSVVKMADKANLKLTSTTAQKGEVNVCNGAIIDYAKQPSIVSYDWSAVAPKDYGTSQIVAKINKYNLSNATLKSTSAFNTNATISASGIITFSGNVDFTTNKNNITFVEDTKFTANKAYEVKLYTGNTVADNKTLTVEEKVALTDGKIYLGTNAKFEGAM